MKFTFWDRVVLYVTGSLPKQTQAQIEFQERELERTAALIKEIAAQREAAQKKKATPAKAKPSLVKDKAIAPSSKKKATPTKKKPLK